ncbi:MAG: DNA primase [Methanocalculaceae archaeon]|jgi:DNA primase|nr:DNA primase [Methanocalculaceae archaeon]
MYSPDTTKYLIHIHIETEGVVEKPDVIGAIFGQTEGLLGEDMDLRELQRSSRIGRIEVQMTSKHGKASGELYIASSLDRAETAILAASLETIERVGPCVATIRVQEIEDLRVIKRRQIVDRAKELLLESFDDTGISTNEILAEVRESIRVEKISSIGEERLPAGPNVLDSDAIIIVEGRADVLNLLKCGIKNTVSVEGTKIPQIVADLSIKKNATAFVDGDRGGDLILRELLQVADIDYVAFSPRGRSVEDMSRKEIIKSLRNKIPADVLRAQIVHDGEIADLVQVLDPTDSTVEMISAETMASVSTIIPEITLHEAGNKAQLFRAVIPQTMSESVQTQKLSQEGTIRTKKSVKVPEIEQKLNTKMSIPEITMVEVPLATVATINNLVEHPEDEIPPVAATEETQQPVLVAEPRTIVEHADWMRQTGRARVLTGEGTVYGDYSLSEMHDILPKLKGDFAGIIIDETVNQRFVDTAAEVGMKFVVAKSFDGVIRRPVSIRMISL